MMRCDIIILFLYYAGEEEGGDYLQIATTWRAAEEGSGAYRSKRRSAAPVLERVAV